ncbi:MAG: hypothetical protein ABFR65_13885 [Pseudomonadota bacterium]
MQPKKLKTLVFTLILTSFFAATGVTAGNRVISEDNAGFCITLPLIDKQALTRQLSDTHVKLKAQQADLRVKVNNQHFSNLDAIITVVLPGGLLYAAVKHNFQLQERRQLKLISQEINQFSRDLLTFQSAASGLRIAALR